MLHHVNSEKLLARLEAEMPGDSHRHRQASRFGLQTVEPVPKFHLADEGLGPRRAYELIHNSLELDGRPHLNMASFVNTGISSHALKLAEENITKNLADSSEYPALMEIHQRCVAIISHLWNTPKGCTGTGTATTGSSEAIHLGGLAMKRRWEARQKERGLDATKPNIIMGANAQVALEKFARYFDVEARIVPVTLESRACLDVSKIRDYVDENTIGVFVILGSTYTGHYEDVEGVSKVLDDYEKETGLFVPIHVDAASGGFVAPFLQPEVKWDFRLDRVLSISTSGHKFGLAVAGVGWIVWKDKKYLPDNLVFVLKYLGGDEESYTLNFSRPGYQVIHQYYNLVALGKEGYCKYHGQSLTNSRILSLFLEATGYFDVLSDIHRKRGHEGLEYKVKEDAHKDHDYYNPGLPVVSFKFSKEFEKEYPEIPQATIATMLRNKGYIVPNYPLPHNAEDVEVLRVVVRADMSIDLLDTFMEDLVNVVKRLIEAVDASRKPNGGKIDAAQVEDVRCLLNVIMLQGGDGGEHEEAWRVHRPQC